MKKLIVSAILFLLLQHQSIVNAKDDEFAEFDLDPEDTVEEEEDSVEEEEDDGDVEINREDSDKNNEFEEFGRYL